MKTVSLLKSKFGLACCIAASMVIARTDYSAAQTAELAEAKHFIELDQPTKAMDVLNKAATTYPTSAAVFYNLGIAQLKAGKREDALKTFDKGIAADPKDGLNYAGKGRISMMENNPQKAKLDFDKALAITKSKNVAVLQAVAEGYMVDPKMSKDALAILLKAKALDDHNSETLMLMGDSYLQQNDGGKTVSSFENAATMDPKNAKAHYKIGLVYLRSRNLQAAEESFKKAIEIDPNYTLAYKEQGELFYQQKRAEEAVTAYEKYLSLTEKPDAGKFKYAFYLLMAKDFVKANTVFKELVLKGDVTPMTRKYYGVSLYEAGDYALAQTTFDEYFTKAKPEEIEAADYAYHGKILLKSGQDSLAMESFKKSLAMEPKNAELLQMSADTYFKLKKFPESIEAFNQLFTYKKASSADYYTLGRAYYFAAQYDKADSAFATLTELQPTMTVGPFWAARSKSAQDSTSENGLAKPYYEKLVEKALLAPDKNKTELIESYMYLGYYSYLKGQLSTAKGFYQKVLALDPNNERAQVAIKALNAPPAKGGGRR